MGRHKKEVWKWIDLPNVKPNYYKISSWGNVVNKNGKKIKYETDKNGYKRCTLTLINGRKKHFFVHRLVAMYFIPNPDNKPEVNHLLRDKNNLYYKYFEWVTSEENRYHSKTHHRQMAKGCQVHPMSTMTNEDVERICQMMEDGKTNKDICIAFGYNNKIDKTGYEKFRGKLKHIRSRRTWTPISRKYKW